MTKKRALIGLGVLAVAALVGWSLVNQARRPAAVGEVLLTAMRKAGFAEHLHPGVTILEYQGQPPAESFELAIAGRVLHIDRAAKVVELQGEWQGLSDHVWVDDPGAPDAPGAFRLHAGNREQKLSPQVRRVEVTGTYPAVQITIDARDYRLERLEGGSIRPAFIAAMGQGHGPKNLDVLQVLARALNARGVYLEAAERLIASQMQALEDLSDESLLQALLSGDAGRLAGTEQPPAAVRQALALAGLDPAEVVVHLSRDGLSVYALTDPGRLDTGESRVRIAAFSADGEERWHATMWVKPTADPQQVRRILWGLTGEERQAPRTPDRAVTASPTHAERHAAAARIGVRWR